MKKILQLVVLGIFLFSSIAYAQDQSTTVTPQKKKPTFWFGPKVGMDLLTPTLDQNAIQSQVGKNYQFGLFMQIGRKFYIQPEAYYATQVVEKTGSPDNTINTLKVPLMFGMRLINLKIVSAHIMGGPSLSYLLKETTLNPDPNKKKSSFALQAGGGIDALGFITLDVRYSVDLNGETNEAVKKLGWDSGVNVTLGIKLR